MRRVAILMGSAETALDQTNLTAFMSRLCMAVKVIPGAVHDTSEIERVVSSFGEDANGGLIILPHAVTVVNRDLIIALTLRYRLPSVTGAAGFLNASRLYYGIDFQDSFRHTA